MRVPNLVTSEADLRASLDTIYANSKNGKSFTGILELAMNEQTIISAIHNIKSNRGAKTAGIDKRTVDHYLQMQRGQLIGLVRQCFRNYQAKPVRRQYISKRNGKLRPLGIPTVVDRIIQECLRIVLEPIAEAKFFEHSYGFRPYRATKHAIRSVTYHATHQSIAIEGDIKGFFDNVPHGLLLKKMWNIGIIDKRVLTIVRKMLKAGVLENGKVELTELGTPQGGILSPLLANIYLNDFDWTIARLWQIPSREKEYKKRICSRYYLQAAGKQPAYLTRYADDWIVQVGHEAHAQTLLRGLHKYFRHKLKLELSTEKTVITDMKQRPAKFLGFNIIAEPVKAKHGKPSSGRLVGKNYPNPERVNEQIKALTQAVHGLHKCKTIGEMAVEVERVNAKITGIAEYWKTGVSKRILTKLDNVVYNSARAVWRRKFGRVGTHKHKIPLNQLSNRPDRHKGYIDLTYAIRFDDMWIGITKAAITAIKYERTMFNQSESPYTPEGRELHAKRTSKSLPNERPPLYNEKGDVLLLSLRQSRYNFEYFMNREYAYNRDKAKCNCCSVPLRTDNRHCHHKRPWLTIDKVNKVSELVWLCNGCHRAVHGEEAFLPSDSKAQRKIYQLRKLLERPNK
jgi:RNA-directed DNA polymerase